MSNKKRKSYSREFKLEAVRLITEKGYSIAEASKNLGIEYSVLRRWKKQLADDPDSAFPGKGKLKAQDEEMRKLQRELERVKEERDILKKALAYFAEDQK
jgi:transposase